MYCKGKYLFSMLAVPVDFLHRDNLVPDWFAADAKVNIPSISPEMLDTTRSRLVCCRYEGK
jgi:hypothetical protein